MRIISLTYWWWLFVLIPCIAKSAVYRYPVAVLSDKTHALVLSQQNQNELELFLYDCSNQTYQKILSSRYLPSGVRLLPDESGFSFIDDGILCIKRFDKRSAHMIDPGEPLYNIEYIHWFDNEYCYFHAAQAGHSGIYMMSIDGTVNTLLPNDRSGRLLVPLHYFWSSFLHCSQTNA